jgi:hypothetical protein
METDTSRTPISDHYTGVVIIHGIGNEKRNATLEEATNALTYWFNHVAGLSLRPEGPGRVWLTTQLTNDDNPDAPASRGTIELAPPLAESAAPSENVPLRLELREVWWAQSFGLPSVRSTLRWARLQFREDAARFLLPLGAHSGPKRLAARHPARETPQALTYQPADRSEAGTSLLPASTTEVRSPHARADTGPRVKTTLLQWALHLYGIVQYVWKVLQWIALAPLIYLLLLLVGIVRLLALIPISLFQYTLVNALSRLVGSFSLHWIAPLQVYLLDYTRSSSMRQHFEREVAAFLDDARCDRIVVIAHSMGTVIAYEGLTTLLTQREERDNRKPLTFICLAQALRRMWLLAGTDPHRLRRALPTHVRWLHFWARYDPVAAGPINPSSLPWLSEWRDSAMPDPQQAISASLAACENIDVVNTDSLFTDHTTYWRNLEQVVGPIARELVVGTPALERLVAAHLAASDDILRRRWRVAWRAMLALGAGVLAITLFMLLDADNRWKAGAAFRHVAGRVLNGVGHALLDGIVGLAGAQFGDVTHYLNQTLSTLDAWGSKVLHTPEKGSSVLIALAHADVLYSGVMAVALAGIFVLIIDRVVAQPSPFTFRRSSPERASSVGGSFAAGMIALVVLTIAALLVSYGGSAATTQALTLYQLGAYVGIAAWILALTSAVRGGHWGWFATILLVSPILLFEFPIADIGPLSLTPAQLKLLALPSALVTLIGCVVVLAAAAGNRRWGRFGTTLVIALALIYTLPFVLQSLPSVPAFVKGSQLVGNSSAELFLVAPLLPILSYGLLMGEPGRGNASWLRYALRLRTLANISLVFAATPFAVYFGEQYAPDANSFSNGTAFKVILLLCGVSALLVGAVPWVLATLGTLRGRRWWWSLTILVVTVAFISLNQGLLEPVRTASDVLDSFVLGDDCLVLSIALFTATLTYALWAGPLEPHGSHLQGRFLSQKRGDVGVR